MTEKKIMPFSSYRAPEPISLPKEFLDRVNKPENLPSAKQEVSGTLGNVWRQCGVPELDIQNNLARISEASPMKVAHTLFIASQLKPRTA